MKQTTKEYLIHKYNCIQRKTSATCLKYHYLYNNVHVNVYFDAYDRLGLVGKPYFEYYNGEECYRYYMDESEKMMKDIKEFLNS